MNERREATPDEVDYRQAAHVAMNAIYLFTALHPEANAHDWRVEFFICRGEVLLADVLPTDRYAQEMLN